MKCPRCQAENVEGARFCEDCGARLEVTCPSCGQPVDTGKRFCRSCGAALTTAATRLPSPQAYTPRHLAEKILTSKSTLEGERKQVTVLFADLKGSMELLADRDPEEARRLLDPVLERMMEAVHRYEGTVNQVMGDGIMALFGAPLAHEDHAVRACYAALRMQESVQRYAQDVQRTEGIPVQIRVGINSGEVVVRSIGSDLHMDYTAVGQSTHLAARMEQMAMPGSILMTGESLRLAEGYVQVKPLGPVAVKGLSESVEVYEVVGAGPVRSRLQAAATRGLSRFVGRQAEMEALGQALEKARGDHGQVVALVGEPGVGKSRIFWELTHSHRAHGWLILESGSVSYGKATAYLPVIDLLKAYFQIELRDEARKVREKLTGKLLTLDRTLESTLPAFLALLDLPVEDAAWQALDPPQRRQRTLDGVKRLLLRESQVQPLLLVFEDLHWIDSETQALLNSLIESLPTARVLLLVNYRPEYQHEWGSKTYYTQLRIDPLPSESAEELLLALLGDDTGLGPLKRLLIERTEGNPFFLEESVRTLVETHALAGDRGAYRLVKPRQSIQVPATVQAVLAARIDRLPPEEKNLLQTAAAVGKDVSFAVLHAVADLSEEALRHGLAHLQAAEFLYETSLFPDLEYTFKHALTHEVAYGSLLQERKRVLHARIVEAIEQRYSDRLAEQVELLANHAFRGEMWEKALACFRQAGRKAFARSAHREAAVCFGQALEALKHLPESRETQEQAIDLRFDLRTSLFPLGEDQRVLDSLREAQALAEAIGDERRLGRALSHMTQYFWLRGDHGEALRSGARALSLATSLNDPALQVTTDFYLGEVYHELGDYRKAVDVLRDCLKALESESPPEGLRQSALPVHARAWLALCLAELGEFPEGSAIAEEGVRVAEARDRSFDLLTAYFAVGHLSLREGDFDKAIGLLERGLAITRAGNYRAWLATMTSSVGYAYLLAGRLGAGLPLLEEAVSTKGAHYRLRSAYLGEAYLQMGRHAEAMALAQRMLERSRDKSERGHEAWALRLLGEIHSHHEPPEVEKAEEYYHQALGVGEDLGMRPLAGHCHLGLGQMYRKGANPDKARQHLQTAKQLFGEMEMRTWLERSEAELKGLG